MTVHTLKCWPPYWGHIMSGVKTFEWRRDDGHGFAVGDTLHLREWTADRGYTGRELTAPVTYVLGNGCSALGMTPGFVILGLGPPAAVDVVKS